MQCTQFIWIRFDDMSVGQIGLNRKETVIHCNRKTLVRTASGRYYMANLVSKMQLYSLTCINNVYTILTSFTFFEIEKGDVHACYGAYLFLDLPNKSNAF